MIQKQFSKNIIELSISAGISAFLLKTESRYGAGL